MTESTRRKMPEVPSGESWEEFACWLIEEYRDMRQQRDKFWDLWLLERGQVLLTKRQTTACSE